MKRGKTGDNVTALASGKTIHVAILGGSGYGAGELLRLFTQHTAARVVSVTTSSSAGEPVATVHPHLRGFYDGLKLTEAIDWSALLAGDEAAVISALPHGASGHAIETVLRDAERRGAAERLRLIDLSGDFRLTHAAQHARHYPQSPLHADRRHGFVYGQPELFPEQVVAARRIANPGCLATASILAAAPLVKLGIEGGLAIDAKTGSSGSGRQLKETTHHPTRHSDFRAYRPLAHQHEPEILQALGDPGGQQLAVSFVAQSMDLVRGIFATVHATLREPSDAKALRRHFESFYAGRPFVRFVDESPTLQEVVGTNFADLAVACRGRQVIALCAIDNLVKGMAGTAVQNLNLMCGLPETTGLWTPSLRPL